MMMFSVIHRGKAILHKKRCVGNDEVEKKLFQVYVLELRLINLSRKTNLHNMKIYIFFLINKRVILIVWLYT